MRIRKGLLFILSFFYVLLAAAGAQEGVTIVETSRVDGAGEPATSTIRLLDDRVRVETAAEDHGQILIYRADMQVMYVIDPLERTYQQITEEDVARMGRQMEEMRAMMEEQLANMPPAQRAMMEEMMKSRMPGMDTAEAAEPVIYSKVAEGERVGEWTCDRYEGYRGGEKVMEICTVGWRDLDLREDDFEVFRELAGFFETLASRMDLDMFPVGTEEADAGPESFPGVPVRRVTYDEGEITGSFEITEVRRESLPPTLFEVPENYRRGPSPFEAP